MAVAVTFIFDFDRALAAVLYLASQPDRVTAFDKYKAGKLLFLADKYHLVRYGHPILGDYYKAFENGPAPQIVMDLLQGVIDAVVFKKPVRGTHVQRLMTALKIDTNWRHPRFSAAERPNMKVLSESEVEALDHIIKLHGTKTFDELYALTHGMPAYRRAWDKKPRRAKVALMRYEDFFEADSDAAAGTYEEMMENAAIRRAFAAK